MKSWVDRIRGLEKFPAKLLIAKTSSRGKFVRHERGTQKHHVKFQSTAWKDSFTEESVYRWHLCFNIVILRSGPWPMASVDRSRAQYELVESGAISRAHCRVYWYRTQFFSDLGTPRTGKRPSLVPFLGSRALRKKVRNFWHSPHQCIVLRSSYTTVYYVEDHSVTIIKIEFLVIEISPHPIGRLQKWGLWHTGGTNAMTISLNCPAW